MSAEEARATSGQPVTGLWNARFEELFRRHLCRHGEFGINVLHFVAVWGIYFSVYALVALGIRIFAPTISAFMLSVLLLLASVPYLTLMLKNVGSSTSLLVVAAVLSLCWLGAISTLPWWAHVLLIPCWHRLQLWSHRIWTRHEDMTAFETLYPKGWRLFVLLSIYELPILLHYLRRCEFHSRSGPLPS